MHRIHTVRDMLCKEVEVEKADSSRGFRKTSWIVFGLNRSSSYGLKGINQYTNIRMRGERKWNKCIYLCLTLERRGKRVFLIHTRIQYTTSRDTSEWYALETQVYVWNPYHGYICVYVCLYISKVVIHVHRRVVQLEQCAFIVYCMSDVDNIIQIRPLQWDWREKEFWHTRVTIIYTLCMRVVCNWIRIDRHRKKNKTMNISWDESRFTSTIVAV